MRYTVTESEDELSKENDEKEEKEREEDNHGAMISSARNWQEN